MTHMGYRFSLANEDFKAKIDMGVYHNVLNTQIKFQSIRTIIHRGKAASHLFNYNRILNWMNATQLSAPLRRSQRNWVCNC